MTHYQALELPENATPADIRRAYRRLVLLTHPDRTADPAAHARYLTINAAYETLSVPARRQAYDATLRWPSSAPSPGPPTSPGKARDARRRARRRPPAPRPAPASADSPSAQTALALRLGHPLFVGSLLLGGTLALDLTFATEQPETIISTEELPYHRVQHLTSHGSFLLPDEVPPGTTVLLKRTPLLHTAISINIPGDKAAIDTDSVYRGASNSFWLGLLLSAAIALHPRRNQDVRLMAGLLCFLFLVLTLLRMFHQ